MAAIIKKKTKIRQVILIGKNLQGIKQEEDAINKKVYRAGGEGEYMKNKYYNFKKGLEER